MSTNNNDERVVITGIGVVSPIGIGKEEFWESLKQGKSGIKPVTLFDVSNLKSRLAGEITEFNPELILGPKGLRNMDRTTKLALCAAKLCLDDAGYEIRDENSETTGVVLGSTMGSVASISDFDKESVKNGPKAVNPAFFQNTVMNSPASQISIRFGIKGFNTTISTGFSSSLDAIEYARKFIVLGRARAVLVGGVEELCEQIYKGCSRVGILSEEAHGRKEMSAPYDKRRNGIVLGEGAALILLEAYEAAIKRKARIYGELSEIGDSVNTTLIESTNRAAAMADLAIKKALRNARIAGKDVDFIAGGANSSLTGDVVESKALNISLDSGGKQIRSSASKSMIGETFSAAAAFQICSGLLAIHEKIASPTINFSQKDNRCNIDCIPNESRVLVVNHVLVTVFPIRGRNSAVVISKSIIDATTAEDKNVAKN